MGRTILPFSMVLAEHQQRYAKFRRTLRKEDQRVFDELFEMARLHVQAAVFASNPDPVESILLGMLIELRKEIADLKKRLADLEPPC